MGYLSSMNLSTGGISQLMIGMYTKRPLHSPAQHHEVCFRAPEGGQFGDSWFFVGWK
jgi:hypothetical protein